MQGSFIFDFTHARNQKMIVAGVDEAGRGPLAGPVIAGAVILDPAYPIAGLTDSKLLTFTEREALFTLIRERALAWSFGRATIQEIDRVNILQATFLAMQRAVVALKIPPTVALIDGHLCPTLPCRAQAIVKGDLTEPAISAASIVAKVLRDRIMIRLDKKYPQYGFALHKGYATQQHRDAIAKHGPCVIHRRSFAPISIYVGEKKEQMDLESTG